MKSPGKMRVKGRKQTDAAVGTLRERRSCRILKHKRTLFHSFPQCMNNRVRERRISMFNRIMKAICLILVAALLFNLLPAQALAEQLHISTQDTIAQAEEAATIVAEVVENRTEYSKEYILSNGLHMAQVYAYPVHYETADGWKDIDNTLTAHVDGTYRNAAGIWQVSFPQTLGQGFPVSITKDGYTLSFSLSGKLSAGGGGAQVMSAQAETFAVTAGAEVTAQLESTDLTEIKASAQFPETVPDKLHSRIRYNSVYANTNVVYDLDSNKVKESIILGSYDSTLRGYRYTLNTGALVPVLAEDGHIDFYDEKGENIILVMPAPFLVDAENSYSFDVDVSLVGKGGSYVLTYTLPQSWLADSSREWPVILDPVIQPSMNVNNIQDCNVSTNWNYSYTSGTLDVGLFSGVGIARAFVKYVNLPNLTSADVVVSAQIRLYKAATQSLSAPVQVHKVLGDWQSNGITWANKPEYDPTVEDYVTARVEGHHYWDITDIVRGWYATGNNYGMMFRCPDYIENGSTYNFKEFWSSDFGVAYYMPTLSICFRNTNGIEDYWDYTPVSAGRAGTGYVNSYTGNLIWTRTHMGFGGSRMPVTISHVYSANDSTQITTDGNNANDSGGNYFGLGNGWRTNFHQRIFVWEADGNDRNYYCWEDEDGTDHYFELKDGNYKDEDGLELTLTINTGNNAEYYTITDKYGNKRFFDNHGRLVKMQNNQRTPTSISVSYTTASGSQISTVTDGAGRVYTYSYTNGLLSRISYYGTGEEEIDWVSFGYTNNNLTSITDKSANSNSLTYNGNILTGVTEDAADTESYRLEFAYHPVNSAFQPYRVASVTEYDGDAKGSALTLSYGNNQTVLTDSLENTQILQFNDFGNVVSVQDGEGHAQYAQYARNTEEQSGKGNQLTLSSKMQNTVGNMLKDHSFENGSQWYYGGIAENSPEVVSTQSYLGSKSLRVPGGRTVVQDEVTLEAGKTYTFSAFVKTEEATTAKLGIWTSSGWEYSQVLSASSDWTRLQASYTNSSTEAQAVTLALIAEGTGNVYMDCVQLERSATASRYNLIENGDFSHTGSPAYSWTGSGLATTDCLSTQQSGAPQLDNNVFAVSGDWYTQKHLTQIIPISGAEGDSFVLSGWAKGCSVPLITENGNARQFGMKLTFHYTDGNTKEQTVNFNPDTGYWQYASTPAVAEKDYSSITVTLLYDYNCNTVYFDGIQLYKEVFGTSYTYDDETGDLISTVDLQNKETTYEYDQNSNLTAIIQDGTAKMTYTYDAWHNVETATTELGQVYNFVYDTYGNNTSVSITAGGKTVKSTAAYTTDGHRLESTTDALGNTTRYDYDADTGLLEWVQYPEDDADSRTNYTYDEMFRMATAAATTDTGLALNAQYGYTDDGLLSTIQTPSTTYTFTYGQFDLRTKVEVGNRTLAEYHYDIHNRLIKLDYGNDDNVQYEYDKQSRIIRETYENEDYVTYSYDNDGNLATVYDSATGITTTYYYDLLGRALYYTKADASGQIQSVQYTYDEKNNLSGLTESVGNSTQGYTYNYDPNNRITSVVVGDTTVTYHYDAFSRLTQKVTKQGETVVKTETYTFADWIEETDEGEKTYTSMQVASYAVTAGGTTTTYSYTYDDNGNILTISDGTNTTSYVYDSANQLVRENHQAEGYTHTWEYNNAGNILKRKDYAYTTGDLTGITPTDTVNYTYDDGTFIGPDGDFVIPIDTSHVWGDLLEGYDGQEITYDQIGNPLTWGNRSFTWEHGRQLASLTENGTTWSYTYGADGLRTSRTNGTKTYTYTYNGSQLVQMTVGTNTLRFTYDAAGTPLTVTYNNTTYYYVTNIQGDVVAIVNASGVKLVEYTYSSWGVVLDANTTTSEMLVEVATILENINPLLYRGYVYDTETGLYYLQSRYYDPTVGRFINGDNFISTGQGILGNNMFSYCQSNPVRFYDPHGHSVHVFDDDPSDIDYDGIVDAGGGGTSTSGYAYAINPIDAGYHYGVDFSMASNSSLTTGGIYGNGYTTYGTYSDSSGSGQTSSFTTGACFVAGTLVQDKDGSKAIEDILAGDQVWAWDEKTKDVSLKKVVETYINETDELTHIFVKGDEIITTPSHPFYSPVKGWTEAAYLRAGDILVLLNGEYVVIEKIQHEILETPIVVYNFQVEDYHTYYVANNGILVHNSCSTPNATTKWDINYNSQGQVKAGNSVAYYDGKYYWLKDTAGHAGSAYKVYVRSGQYLYWAYDADMYGNYIYGKHKSDKGKIISIR